MGGVRVEVLGPLRLLVDGTPVEVPGPKRRAALALLALAGGRTVPVDHLLDALWPGGVPDSGRQALHTHVSRLRTLLGPAADRLRTLQDGYRLELAADELDLAQARALLARTKALDDPAAALPLLRQAHALWRGPVLADLTDVPPIAVAVEEQERLRQEVTDALVGRAVEAGDGAGVVGQAAAAHAADPLREPGAVLLMRALAASGQPAEALRVGREFRRMLADETGLDPSPALGEVERAVAAGAAGPAPAAPGRPTPATRLIGREEQVSALRRLLAEERLVTVVGPGGVGKTRVALEVAGRGETPVVLLAPVTDPAGLPHALAAALDLKVSRGDVLASCLALLGDRPGLLVVDNCEHLLAGARELVEALLAGCPRLSVLATSREPLGLAAEYTYRLAPLPVPHPGGEVTASASVALFLERARRARPGPPPGPAELRLVADIVRRLDGLPLAIELAAGRLSSLSLADLHARLDRSLDLLGGARTGDARHRTLRATVEWSYQLLTDDEQRLFRHLALFADGADLDTAEQLAADLGLGGDPGSLLARLVDASLLDADFADGTRYRMLETLRAFGSDRLAAAGEAHAAEALLVRWAVGLTERIRAGLDGAAEAEADATLRREIANLRVAWRLARRSGDLDSAAAIVIALFEAIGYRDLVELRGWAEELAADPALAAHPRAAAVLGVAAEGVYHRGDAGGAERLARTGLERGPDPDDAWYGRMALAVVALARGEFEETAEHALAAVAAVGEHRECLGIAALAAAYGGDLDTARELNGRGTAAAVSPSMRSWAAYVAGEIEGLAGDLETAEAHYRTALRLARGVGATFLAGVASVGLLAVLARAGRVHDALRGYTRVVDGFARTGNWTHLWTTLRNLADLLRTLGDDRTAALIDAAADLAPDAPAVAGARPFPSPDGPVPDRTEILRLAHEAVTRADRVQAGTSGARSASR
ncbi:BTAD domain-containing putative transcriptional regulator [Pseudonocardia halophobica]|uniref:BTAD domain-containing putative transcriptional regulator n=1 Tax=Pseudonocardia halophobica TaxID=29401 RepID=UPI003D8D5E93